MIFLVIPLRFMDQRLKAFLVVLALKSVLFLAFLLFQLTRRKLLRRLLLPLKLLLTCNLPKLLLRTLTLLRWFSFRPRKVLVVLIFLLKLFRLRLLLIFVLRLTFQAASVIRLEHLRKSSGRDATRWSVFRFRRAANKIRFRRAANKTRY